MSFRNSAKLFSGIFLLQCIHKSVVRPYLDYSDIIYDQPNNESFIQKIERIQYNATLAIIGPIKEISQSKLYIELIFESLKFRCWFRILCIYFFKLKTNGLPKLLFHQILAFCKILHHFTVESFL